MMSIYPICVYNCRLFRFHYYVTSLAFYQKQNVRAFIIILGVVTSLAFYQKKNVRTFIIILGVTMKAVAFES